MTGFPPIPTADESIDGIEAEEDSDDPWPLRCEWLAALLALAAGCFLASSIANGWRIDSSQTFGSSNSITFGTRLRLIGETLNPFDALLCLGAILLIALDGITSGEKRAPSTNAGRLALYCAGGIGVVVALGSLATFIDILLGNIGPGFSGLSLHYRLPTLFGFLATGVLGATAVWLAFVTMDDAVEATDVLEEGDLGPGDEDDLFWPPD